MCVSCWSPKPLEHSDETFPAGAAFVWVIRGPLEAAKLLADDGGRGPEGYWRKLCSTRSNDHLQVTAVDGLEIPRPTTERMYKTLWILVYRYTSTGEPDFWIISCRITFLTWWLVFFGLVCHFLGKSPNPVLHTSRMFLLFLANREGATPPTKKKLVGSFFKWK